MLLTAPALALTTSVPAFWIRSVNAAISSSENEALGDVYYSNIMKKGLACNTPFHRSHFKMKYSPTHAR